MVGLRYILIILTGILMAAFFINEAMADLGIRPAMVGLLTENQKEFYKNYSKALISPRGVITTSEQPDISIGGSLLFAGNRTSLELGGGISGVDVVIGNAVSTAVRSVPVFAHLLFNLMPAKNHSLIPYIGGGIVGHFTSVKDKPRSIDELKIKPGFDIVGGIEFRLLKKRISINLDGVYRFLKLDSKIGNVDLKSAGVKSDLSGLSARLSAGIYF